MAELPNRLQRIIDYKKGEVAALRRNRSLSSLEADAKIADKPRGFSDVLLRIARTDGNALAS